MRLLTLRSVLVATDLEPGSEAVVRTAAQLAELAGAELHLLHIASEPNPETADDALREQLARVAPRGMAAASVRVMMGFPARVIVEEAIRLRSDAVILGPHRGGSRKAGELGSTAATVVRTAPCPCLVVPADLRLPLERVLVAIEVSMDHPGVPQATLGVALSWASALRPPRGQARLTALHVTADPSNPAIRAAVRRELEMTRADGGEAARVEILESIAAGDDTAAAILREADTATIDLLVIGTRGPAGVSTALGSVSTEVARSTRCPLLLVPPGR